MKKLKPVNIQLDDCMDADDYGQRLTECIEQMSENTDVVNLVKVRIGDNITSETFMHILKNIAKDIREMGAKNCVYVPLKKGLIEDITIEYIKVVDDEFLIDKQKRKERKTWVRMFTRKHQQERTLNKNNQEA